MPRDISVVVPAYNESDRIGETLHAIKQLNSVDEIVVVDDGSADNTYDIAREWADVLIRREHNHGKGPALDLGWRKSKGDVIVFLDADLGATAALAENLIEPVISDQCDMSVASFPPAETKGGFGLVKTLAAQGVEIVNWEADDSTAFRSTGHETTAAGADPTPCPRFWNRSVPDRRDA